MITSNELELRSTLTLGKLESNAEAIRDLIQVKLQEYTPDNYKGRADEAKQDRAVLNAAEKQLNSKRLELEREYMEPFNKFKGLITETCKAIKAASNGLDEIVKAEETREKNLKRYAIEAFWNNQNFTLFPLEKVFNEKWLNKTTKQKDVEAEINEIITKALSDLEVIENFPAEDVPLIKAVYLDTLSLSDAIAKSKQLKENRDKLAREKQEREAIKTQQALKQQAAEEIDEINRGFKEDAMAPLVSEALGVEVENPAEKVQEFALILRGTRNQLLGVRRYMTENGVKYDKLEDKGDGVYIKQ